MKVECRFIRCMYALAVVTVVALPLRAAELEEADLVLFNGKVITVDSQDRIAQAVAIREGKVTR